MRWRVFKICVVSVLVAVALPLVGAGLVCWIGWDEHTGPCDVALVLGNAVSPEGVVSERLRARLDRAAELYHAGLVKKIIASGGVDANGTDEAAHMARYLEACGVPEVAIVLHSEGRNSYFSAKFAAEGVRRGLWQSVTVVSQFYHVPRVRMALAFFGTPAGFWARPNYVEKGDFFRVLRELAACVRYFFHDYRWRETCNRPESGDRAKRTGVLQSCFAWEGVFARRFHAKNWQARRDEVALCRLGVGRRYIVCDGIFRAGCFLVSGAQGEEDGFFERSGNRQGKAGDFWIGCVAVVRSGG
jgi:vancomycin permeability regulator SanA